MIYDEDNFPDLPSSWTSLYVELACDNLSIREKIQSKNYLANGRMPVVDQGATLIGGFTDDIEKAVAHQLPVVVFGDHTRIIKFVDFLFAAGADGIKVLMPKDFLIPRIFYRFLQAIRLPDKGYARHFQHLRTSRIAIPPLAEQKRIADKLDALLARVDTCHERLGRVPLILKRFRQAVLAAATSGQLTQDWRNEVSVSQEFVFEDAQCFGRYRFPISWKPLRLQDIAEITGGITKDSKKEVAENEEIAYLRVANVQRGYFDLSEIKTIKVPTSRIKDLLLQPGDILFNEGGDIDKLGRGWVWSGEIQRCIFQNHIFRARLNKPDFVPKFFSWYGNSRGYDYFLARGKQTTNLASINKSVLSALPVVVPPSSEQHEIVRRVETLFAFADRLEARYNAARAQVERLTPALLAKAFRGELVPQDPNDEPASVLLERIRAERTPASASGGNLRGRKTPLPSKKQSKSEVIMLQRKDIQPSHLTAILKTRGPLTAEALWSASELEIDEFYDQLKDEEVSGRLREVRGETPTDPRLLEAI